MVRSVLIILAVVVVLVFVHLIGKGFFGFHNYLNNIEPLALIIIAVVNILLFRMAFISQHGNWVAGRLDLMRLYIHKITIFNYTRKHRLREDNAIYAVPIIIPSITLHNKKNKVTVVSNIYVKIKNIRIRIHNLEQNPIKLDAYQSKNTETRWVSYYYRNEEHFTIDRFDLEKAEIVCDYAEQSTFGKKEEYRDYEIATKKIFDIIPPEVANAEFTKECYGNDITYIAYDTSYLDERRSIYLIARNGLIIPYQEFHPIKESNDPKTSILIDSDINPSIDRSNINDMVKNMLRAVKNLETTTGKNFGTISLEDYKEAKNITYEYPYSFSRYFLALIKIGIILNRYGTGYFRVDIFLDTKPLTKWKLFVFMLNVYFKRYERRNFIKIYHDYLDLNIYMCDKNKEEIHRKNILMNKMYSLEISSSKLTKYDIVEAFDILYQSVGKNEPTESWFKKLRDWILVKDLQQRHPPIVTEQEKSDGKE